MKTEKDRIMARIRQALKTPSARPGHHEHIHSPAVEAPSLQARVEVGRWLPAVGATEPERLALFAEKSLELKTDFQVLESEEAAKEKLRELALAEGWERIASHRGQLTGALVPALERSTLYTDDPYQAAELEKCAAGITECDALIAQTGSVFITAKSAGGRALSVLPPHHVVLARRSQMLPDLPGAFAFVKKKYAPQYPSFLSVITGPSRTGDIERILVLGAHGPKKLTVLCW